MRVLFHLLLAVVAAAGVPGISKAPAETGTPKKVISPARPPAFDDHVWPILRRCIGCHGPDRPKANLNLTERASVMDAGAIVPHDASASSLIERVTSDDPEFRMPPDGGLTSSEVQVLRAWIDAGAVWPTHWSYRKLTKPNLPTGTAADWCENPIDRFVVARLAQVPLSPSPPADRRTLLRRVYYDLIGLPPNADELEQFAQDRRPEAYDRIVDQLLASPQYGERWARHWMDVVHFAETHGHDQDRPREHAWPYRDYLIRRLNQDVPYAQFVREQIAGDVLYPVDPWAIVGTGLLAAGPWDESSLRDIQENSLDREIGRYLDRDDIVTTVMSTFASTSVHCARCHHHKFDPISQADYYGLQAVFAGIDKANRPYEPDAEVAQRRQARQRELKLVAAWSAESNPCLLDANVQAQVDAWEGHQRETRTVWKPVEWIEFRSGAGATMTRQDDNSVYVDGERPETDSYTILIQTNLPRIRALRLAVLPDDRLPQNGPGRQDNGNLHLNEVRVFSPAADGEHSERQLQITAVQADFNQAGWSIEMAVDGNPSTAWGIHPEVGKPHYAVFELAEFADPDTTVSGAMRLRIELDQVHGAGHLIGRFSLSVTNDDGPLLPQPILPGEIARVLNTALSDRTEAQRIQLAAYVMQQQLQSELAALPEPALVYCGTNRFEPDGSFRPATTPRDVHVLDRGEVSKPLRLAQATTISCVEGLRPDAFPLDGTSESLRRSALADWFSRPDNGLVWRAIANRVWHYHFGKPLVDTLNDFGHAGSSPTHPELLDWLAATLQENAGSLKTLHRLIVTSATYQQSSNHRDRAARLDADNRLLWRMNRARLDAESFRDSLLKISESLDRRMGGPSDRQFLQSNGVHVTPVVDYQHFDVRHRSNYRRSVYRFLFRTLPDPFMESLDCPDASQLSPKRAESVTAVQTLATLNDKSVIHQSELLAERIAADESSIDDQVVAAYRRILCRSPTAAEQVAVGNYAVHHGLANACRILLNTNEFMFVD